MNNVTSLTIPTTDLDRRAAALADVHQMHEDLRKALDAIGQLKADLSRERDRCALLLQERRQLSSEMHLFRDKCMELATCVANIGLQTISAQNIVMTVRELTEKSGEEAIAE